MSFLAAIIGMACRLPGGVSTPEELWSVLTEKRDPIGNPPRDRWDDRRVYDPNPASVGKTCVNQAGFLSDLWGGFDPHFFGISAREAAVLDPQQRLLLAVAWEALENAGVPAERVSGSQTGVFIGGFSLDTYLARLDSRSLHTIDSHTAASLTMTMLAGRVAHSLDLRGPAVSMDTACSSSLVATHFAFRSLAAGDCEMALVGGVNVILLPAMTITANKGKFLSPDGRCMTFDERANGYVRSEGAGMVVMKPLERARADGDRIYAVVRMTGVNQDGHTSGISLPSPEAQKQLLRKVYSAAGVCGGDIDYIEAHGTGTQAGDLAEVTALDDVLRDGRPEGVKCRVGSIKSNIGHLEAAAGVTGLIKACLVAHKGRVTPNLHMQNPNPKLELERRCIQVTTENDTLPSRDRPWLIGVNSFGYAGTNAHVLLEQWVDPAAIVAPKDEKREEPAEARKLWLLPLSTRDERVLPSLAERYAQHLKSVPAPFADVAHSLVHRRSHHARRAAVFAYDNKDLRLKLLELAKGADSEFVVRGQVTGKKKVAFAFSGMGPQWWGMGQTLYRTDVVFREGVDECDRIFRDISGWSIRDAMLANEITSRVGRTIVAQPANFVLQVALTRLLASWGIEPAGVIGHSNGEIAASWACGALSLRDALLVCFHRARLLDTLAGQGSMLAVGFSEEEAIGLIHEYANDVCVAAVNSKEAITLAGSASALSELQSLLEQNEVFARTLHVEVAYHSHYLNPLEGELHASLASIRPHPTSVLMYSSVTANRIGGPELDAGYWWRNMRSTVRFAAASDALLRDEFDFVLEIGAHPVLTAYLREAADRTHSSAMVISTLSRKKPEDRALLETAATLWCAGGTLEWEALIPKGGHHVPLPPAPWQRFDTWDTPPACAWYKGTCARSWLQEQCEGLEPSWRVQLTQGMFPWLNDHRLGEEVVFPGAGYIEAGLMLSREIGGGVAVLSGLRILSMLTLHPDQAKSLVIRYLPKLHGFQISSSDASGTCQLHCEGRIAHGASAIPQRADLSQKLLGLREIDVLAKYAELDAAGLCYGPCFRSMKRLFVRPGRVLAELELPSVTEERDTDNILHPVMLDGALQALACIVEVGSHAYVPTQVERLIAWRPAGRSAWAEICVSTAGDSEMVAQIQIFDSEGNVLAELENVTFSAISLKEESVAPLSSLMFEPVWVQVPAEAMQEKADSPSSFSLIGLPASLRELRESLSVSATSVQCYLTVDEMLMSSEAWFDSVVVLANSTMSTRDGIEEADRVLDEITNAAGDLAMLAGQNRALQVWILTRGALRTGHEKAGHTSGVIGTALWSLARVVRNEYPQLSLSELDLDPQSDADWASVCDVLRCGCERELARREGKWFEQRLQHLAQSTQSELRSVNTITTNVVLTQQTPGSLELLGFKEENRRKPGPGECEIRTCDTSVGYKDLLKLTGLIDAKALAGTYWGPNVGMAATGTVVGVGPNLIDRKVGDRVFFLAKEGAFRAYATVDSASTSILPPKLPLSEIGYAAAWTAHRALVELARLSKGESVLIHNAAGAVGLYAIQVARHLGARVFATVSTDAKREFLLSQGVEAVYDSRSIDFGRQVRIATAMRGVDVVLGAVHGDAMRESFDALAIGGRYVEIGKRDIAENNSLPLGLFHRNLTYFALDLDGLLATNAVSVWETCRAVMRLFESGVYKAINATSYPASAASNAFRAMADRSRIGLVAIHMENEIVNVSGQPQIRRDASYLVTGGLSGFGLEVAHWLAKNGAGAMVLVSRRGAADESTRQRLSAIAESGTVVHVAAVDVSDKKALADLLASVRETLPPLRGVFHGAMVLDDRPLLDMGPDAFATVFRPKVGGALNLHELVANDPIEHFVLFSSISSLIGNPHQANYSAANAALDALAHERHAAGLPATSINWGTLGESGVVARNEALASLSRASGVRGLKNITALAALESILSQGSVQVGVLDVDWTTWAKVFPKVATLPMFAAISGEVALDDQCGIHAAIRLSSVPPPERPETMLELLLEPVASVLRTPRDRIDTSNSLTDLGLDSLMATEAAIVLEQEFGLKVPIALLLDGRSLKQLSNRILDLFGAHVLKHEQQFAASCANAADEVENLRNWVREMQQRDEVMP